MARTKKAAQRKNNNKNNNSSSSNINNINNNDFMSQQPPLPAGLPARPSQQLPPRQSAPPANPRYGDSYNGRGGGGGDSHRGDEYYQSNYQSRPRDQEVFQFGAGHSYRPNYDQRPRSPPRYNDHAPGVSRNDNYRGYNHNDRDRETSQSYRPTQSTSFDFRHDAPPGLDYRAPQDNHHARRRDYVRGNDQRAPAMRAGNARGGARGAYRGRGGPRLAADRDFLKTNREPTPELMTGMEEDGESGAKYIAPDDVSDSEEEDMDISGSEDNEAQEHKKKQARTTGKAADGDSVPRWSNPDPYTALPPPDESRGKKKDVVKLIRKARVTGTADHVSKAATTDDFISFDFDDEESEGEDVKAGVGVQGAPTGPRVISGSANQVNVTRPATLSTFNQDERQHGEQQFGPQSQASGSNLPRSPPTQHETPLQLPQNSGKGMGFQIKAKASDAPANKKIVIDLTSDPVLGTRKRTVNDEIKNLGTISKPPIVHAPRAGRPIGKPSGKILSGWARSPSSSATPWLGIDHSDSAGMGVWLHKEIMDFYDYVKPRDFEQEIRLRLVEELRSKFKQYFYSDDDIQPFGSFPAGLYLPTSDMDLVCISREYTADGRKIFGQGHRGLANFCEFLRKYKFPLDNQIEVISKAKVPLVKYMDNLTGLKVDVSFENTTGIVANTTFQNWKKEFPAVPILVTLIKHLLAMRGLNEPVNGGIGGFSVTCLVVSLLQNMPQVQSRNLVPEHHLGEILMEFLDLYGNQFNTLTTAIIMNPPGYLPKKRTNIPYNKRTPDKFCIIDPNRPDNDISGGSSNTSGIRKCFSEAYDALQHRMGELQRSENRKNQSLLDCIIGGNYKSFELQRAHLAHVHKQLYG
ncbi:hypothetical protein LZ554_005363 [Drepanopeziza brunnea f. sp. 'monogermtubi']|nr:hypothetical protein LZ554_005363 [Drepanopeziza brunnea f. sp. 'monogermtubi']